MNKLFFIVVLIFAVSVTVVAIGYVLSSQIEYVDLINKEITISEDDDVLLVMDEDENIAFRYSIENWRGEVRERWDSIFREPMEIQGTKVGPDGFTRFTAVSPFPDGVKTLVFSVSTYAMPVDYSLFWTLNIATGETRILGERNKGVVGNIIWSPKETHFAYFLNTERAAGDYLTLDNVETREKEFTVSGREILEALEVDYDEDFMPEFRSLRWREDGERFFFTTDTTEEEVSANWSIDLKGLNIRREN